MINFHLFCFLIFLILGLTESQNPEYSIYTNQRMSHARAQEFCHRKNLTLVSILSTTELDQIRALFEIRPLIAKFWVSASDLYSEGNFYWSIGNRSLGRVANNEINENIIRPEIQNNCAYYHAPYEQFMSASCTFDRAVPVCEKRDYNSLPINNSTGSQNSNIMRNILCHTGYDTVTEIDREIFVFRGNLVWTIKNKGELPNQNPALLSNAFPFPNGDVPTQIDAGLVDLDSHIVLFSGNRFWIFNTDFTYNDGPRSLESIGLPSYIKKIDGVFARDSTSQIFIYSGTDYWRMNEHFQMDEDYPQDLTNWWPYLSPNRPKSIDGAFVWEGNTYFIKGDTVMRYFSPPQEINPPQSLNEVWFGC